jgi:FixJ family two-component response regulator
MIFLIDDDKSVTRAFEILLRSAGYDITAFESADEFLLSFEPGHKDLLVLDLNLPGMSGCELLKKFRLDGIEIPVVVVTADNSYHFREFCKEYGVKAYMRKPTDSEALLDIIRYNLNT